MEVFPSIGESSADYIREIINECDYYIMLIGGKYGSIAGESGISFTELEYQYALGAGKPILAFIKENINELPLSKVDTDQAAVKKLERFKEKVLGSHLIKYYKTVHELGAVVSRSMISLIKNKPAIGWVRDNGKVEKHTSSTVSGNKEIKDELYRLNKKVDDLLFMQKQNEESEIPVSEKVRVFIGSSVEGLEVARCIQAELAYDYAVEIWNQGTVFGLGDSTLEALERAVRNYDIGVFVFTPDDELLIRDENKPVARDNVIFELGLFIGKLTRFRAFIVRPGGNNIALPSDLHGITTATFDPKLPNLRASLGPACHAIRRIEKA
jgi:predicted nucleotide-binding protein